LTRVSHSYNQWFRSYDLYNLRGVVGNFTSWTDRLPRKIWTLSSFPVEN
jgi:hypothetical protein